MDTTNFSLSRWPLKEWGAVLDIRSGRNQREVLDDNGTFPIIGSAGKVMGYANSYLCDEGTTVLGRKGTINNPLYFEQKFWNVDTAFGLVAGSELEKKFLYYFCLSVDFTKLDKGTTLPSLVKKDLVKVLMPVPGISEQKRIVAILDQAFADMEQARANTEQNLKNARELFESYLQQVFSQRGEGWIEKSLKEASLDFGRGKSKHRPRNDESLYGGNYPFIQTGDVRNCEHFITKYSKTYNDKGLAQSKLWPKGTICITIAANIAETGIMDFDGCFPDSVIGVVVNPEVTMVSYVEYLLQSFKAILQAKGQGSAQDNINMGTFEKMKFPFPSIQQQEEIVNSLDSLTASVQQLERVYSDKLLAIDELKKSILQKAFSGELTKENKGVAA